MVVLHVLIDPSVSEAPLPRWEQESGAPCSLRTPCLARRVLRVGRLRSNASVSGSSKAAAHSVGSGETRAVTSCQTYCAEPGSKTLQARPSKAFLSNSNSIFPALCFLAEDRLLKILPWIWLMFLYFKENIFIFLHVKPRYTVEDEFAVLMTGLSKIYFLQQQQKNYL